MKFVADDEDVVMFGDEQYEPSSYDPSGLINVTGRIMKKGGSPAWIPEHS